MAGYINADLTTKCSHAVDVVCKLVTKKKGPPLRIVFLGKHGSGKSSFINSVAAAFARDRWQEYAYTGFRGDGTPITIFTQKFEKCCNGKMKRFQSVPLPTLIDVAGGMDFDSEKFEELLRLLLYGHLKDETSIMKAYDFCEQHTIDQIRKEYGETYPDMRVDRVVFVASAADSIPDKLIRCVMRIARPDHTASVSRSIPVFGVLTKKDKVKDITSLEFKEKKETFMQALGLHSNRFLLCSNYCDETDPDFTRERSVDPNLDLPILEFFQQLCSPAFKVIHDTEQLPGTRSEAVGYLCRSFAVLLVACLLVGVFSPRIRSGTTVKNQGVTHLSLGVGTSRMHQMNVIIIRNTNIPVSVSKGYTTQQDNQAQVGFGIYAGERARADDNKRIGYLMLSELPPAPRGTPSITVTLALDAAGVLKVTARDRDSGKEASVTIDNYLDGLSQDDIEDMVKAAEKNSKEDGLWNNLVSSMSELEDYAHSTKRAALYKNVKKEISQKDYETVMDACDDAFDWLDTTGKQAAKSDIDQKLRKLERQCAPIMAKYQN